MKLIETVEPFGTLGQLYRYESMRYSVGVDEFDRPYPDYHVGIELHAYTIVKRTPKGAWINDYNRMRFILLAAKKKFACETVEEAKISFIARKQRQIKILKGQLEFATRSLEKINNA